MNNIEIYQINILCSEAVVCAFIAFFTIFFRSFSKKKRFVIIGLELSTYVTLMSYAVFNSVGVIESSLSNMIIKNAVFYNFVFINILMVFYVKFLEFEIYPENDKNRKVPMSFFFMYLILFVGCLMDLISVFTGFFFYVDEQKIYHQGPFYKFSLIFPVVIMVVATLEIIKNRKRLKRTIANTCLLFLAVPFVTTIVEIASPLDGWIDISLGSASILLFILLVFEQTQQLAHMAVTDGMTRLPNVLGMKESINEMLNQKDIKEYAAVYVDLKGFARVNQLYGEDAGNSALIQVGNRLTSLLDEDEIVGRLGGNLFFVLCKQKKLEDVLNQAKEMKLTVFKEGTPKVFILNAYVGAYIIGDDMVTPGQLIENARLAMTFAKKDGENLVYKLDEESLAKVMKDINLTAELPAALKKGDFTPYYQPIVDTEKNEILAVEALVRWIKDGQLIMPSEFLRFVEDKKFIVDLDFYVLERVCIDMANWITSGVKVPSVTLNFSVRTLESENYTKKLYAYLQKYHIPFDHVVVEVSGNSQLNDAVNISNVVEDLREHGIMVAIDDGLGGFSLNIIKKIHFDALKIDKKSIENLEDRDLVILEHIIKIAEELKMLVVVEGVESDAQLKQLQEFGCTRVQGYVTGDAMSRDKLEVMLSRD